MGEVPVPRGMGRRPQCYRRVRRAGKDHDSREGPQTGGEHRQLGLPRIVRTEEDIQWFLNAVPNKHNGLTFCAGSLSAGAYNNVVEMAKKFASRTHFVHLRSCHIFPNGDFTEASHLGGRADIIELCRIFEKENPQLPMRVDHGMTFTDQPGGIMDESSHGHNAGYTLLGRMFALGQVQGILATVDRELGIDYKQPGFYD